MPQLHPAAAPAGLRSSGGSRHCRWGAVVGVGSTWLITPIPILYSCSSSSEGQLQGSCAPCCSVGCVRSIVARSRWMRPVHACDTTDRPPCNTMLLRLRLYRPVRAERQTKLWLRSGRPALLSTTDRCCSCVRLASAVTPFCLSHTVTLSIRRHCQCRHRGSSPAIKLMSADSSRGQVMCRVPAKARASAAAMSSEHCTQA